MSKPFAFGGAVGLLAAAKFAFKVLKEIPASERDEYWLMEILREEIKRAEGK